MRNMVPDALSLEYKRDYGCARGQLEFADIVNNPMIASEFCRLGLSLPKKTLDLLGVQLRPGGHDSGNPLLIAVNIGKNIRD